MAVNVKSLVAAAALAVSAAPAPVAVVTSLVGGTSVAMPVLNNFGPGPQVFGPGIGWTSTNATNGGGAVFGATDGYGFGINGDGSGFPMAGVDSNLIFYGVADSMAFTLPSPVSGFGGRINWYGDSVPTTIAA
ncbi:hypothetical protein [Thermaurantiacus sp.]